MRILNFDPDTLALICIVLICACVGLLGHYIGRTEGQRKADCTLTMAYIPINGKWLEKQICLESLK